MNIVRELRKKRGIQQKELALEIGVSNAAVSDWENGKKDPTGERLHKLADYFGVDEQFILGYGQKNPNYFIPENPRIIGKSETEQIVQYVLDKLGTIQPAEDDIPKTSEARILAKRVDRLPEEKRKQALALYSIVFENHSEDFEKGTNDDDT